MLISEYIEIRTDVNNSQLKFYEELGYDINLNPITVLVNDLTKGSSYKVLVRCDYCYSEKEITYKSYNKTTTTIDKYACCKLCASKKAKEIMLIKYGVDSKNKLDHIKEKSKKSLLEKYGVDNPMKDINIKNKLKKSLIEKYGVDNISKLDIIKNKIKETLIEKYGVDSVSKIDGVKNKIKNTNLERYGVDNPMKDINIKNKLKKSLLEKYGVDNPMKDINIRNNFLICNDPFYLEYIGNKKSFFTSECGHNYTISSGNYFDRKRNNIKLCTICNPIGDSKSIKEKELYHFIKEVYNEDIIQSYRDGLEIDIYLPELSLGFEFNGLYWHSEEYKDKNYHLDKTNYFKEKGIRIIHIWEDDWDLKKEIVKSMISNFVKKSKKIYARKCQIKEANIKECKNFLEANHIQGNVGSILKLGLYHENELVSLMTFDHNEGRKKMLDDEWNLSRFCNNLNTNVIGGASKLFSYFMKNYNPNRVVSYADKDWSIGNLYYTLGFENINESKPDYKYIVEGKRIHKSRFRKSKTNISESLLKISKIWDCGKIKFEYVSN